jgi:uncharacterized protein GlcG (DUF336 family)
MSPRILRLIIAVASICALAAPASAQPLVRKDLSLAMALTVATTAVDACKALNQRVSATVVGRNGEVIVQLRGDNASPHTVENSFRKAYTARTFRVPSGEIVKRLKDNPQLGAIHLTNVIAAQGALPIMIGGDVIGAAGVSGGVTTPESPGGVKDEGCVKAGLDKIADQLK